LADGQAGGNGVYRYGASGFPSSSYHATNYWVDVVFKPDSATTGTDAGTSTGTDAGTGTGTDAGTTPSSSGLRGWQLTESNTGLAGAGVDRNSLPVYTGPSKPAAGTVIRLQKITSPLVLSNGNITLDRVWVQPTASSGQGSVVFTYDPSFSTPAPSPVTIIDSDIDGSLVTDPQIYVDCAVRGVANIQRNNMFGMGGGICIFGSSAMSDVLIEHNYVHDLRGGLVPGMGQSHNESATIRSFGGSSLIFRDNRLISKTGSDSGALFIQAWAGFIDHTLIEGNLLDSWGWDLPLEANANGYGTDMRSRNNRFGKSGYGAGYVTGGSGWAEWTQNYYDDPASVDDVGAIAPQP
jgi:hypothetical protein